MSANSSKVTNGVEWPPNFHGQDADALTSLADVVDRLDRDFGPVLGRSYVIATVRRCRRELDIVSREALPEFVERLARERLTGRVRAEG